MAASPRFKVYDSNGTYQASAREVAAAVVVAAFYGSGSTVRTSHSKKYTVWTDGEMQGASYDEIAAIVDLRELT